MKQLSALSCRYSKNSGETTMLMLSWRQRRTVRRHTQGSCLKPKAWWDPIQPEAMTCQSMQKLIPQVMFAFFGNQSEKRRSFLVRRFLKWNFVRNQKDHSQICASKQLIRFSLPLDSCSSHLRQRPQHHWGQFCAYCKMHSGQRCKMYSGHQEKGTGDQIKSSETTILCVPSLSWASNEDTPSCSTTFRKKKVLRKVQHYRVDVIAGDATAAAYRYYKRQSCHALYNSSVAVMLREVQREVNMNHPFQEQTSLWSFDQ